MKLLIVSDSHGRDDYLTAICADHLDADAVIHLGDGEHDFGLIEDYPAFKGKKIYQVKGNCDFTDALPTTRFENIGGHAFYLTHGYLQHVKMGLEYIYLDAKKNNRDIVLFGHTHTPTLKKYDGVTLFNPGAVCNGRYGILTISDDGTCSFEHCSMEKQESFGLK